MTEQDTDKEILLNAAKAAGIKKILCYESKRNLLRIGDRESYSLWDPLNNDKDVFRLALICGLTIDFAALFDHFLGVEAKRSDLEFIHCEIYNDHEETNFSLARRAIVRAASEIGKSL